MSHATISVCVAADSQYWALCGSDGIVPMAVQDVSNESRQRQDGPEHTPRLKLKRKAPMSGYVDGAWWPHSDDLAAELPDLLAVLSVRLGAAQRVNYHLGEWAAGPRKMTAGGHVLRLDGYHNQPPNTLGFTDGRGQNLVLLVVPADTEAELAHNILMAVATADDATSVGALLASSS